MMYRLNATPLLASADGHHWAGFWSDPNRFVFIELLSGDPGMVVDQGDAILHGVVEELKKSQATRLELNEAIGKLKRNPHVRCAVLGLLEGTNLILAGSGRSLVQLFRKGKFGTILRDDGFSDGQIQSDDKLIIPGFLFREAFDPEKIRSIITQDNPVKALEEARMDLMKNEAMKGTGCVVVTVSEQEEIPPEALPEVPSVPEPLVETKEEKKPVEPEVEPLLEPKPSTVRVNRPIGERLRSLARLLKDKVTVHDEAVGISPEKARSKKRLFILALVITVLLVGSVFFNFTKNRSAKRMQILNQALELTSQQYDESVSLTDINPVRARELLSSAKLNLAPLIKDFPKDSEEYKTVNDWLGKISSQEAVAYKIYKLTAVPLFFDLSFIKTNGVGSMMASFEEQKAILDTTNQAVYTLTTDKKQSAIVAGSDVVKDAKSIAVYGTNVYALNSDGIVSIGIKNKTTKVIIPKDSEWGEIGKLVAFGGNLYLMDKTKNTIWKYITTTNGFSERETYLNPDVRFDFSNALDMVIDGNVWVLTSGGLVKFSRGLQDTFGVTGFSDTITEYSRFSTLDTNKNIYILDKGLSRIIVIDKSGVYQSQYQWDELKNAQDLIASDDEKKIFVLVGGKIYAIEMK